MHEIATTTDNCNFLVTAPTTKIFHQATLPALLANFKGMGEYKATLGEFQLSDTKKIYLRTVHEPDAIEGITNAYAIWADEAGMYKRKAWINIMGRAAFKSAPIFVTTTPYALNWLWSDLYKPWKEGKIGYVDFFQFPSIDNPFFPKDEFARQKQMLDPKVFAMKYLGEFERMAGLVYADLDDELNYCEPFEPTTREYFIVAGIDFGYSNPMGITVRAMHRKEKRDYQTTEFYKSYLDTAAMQAKCLEMQNKHNIELWYGDCEDPQAISDLAKVGIKITGVKKFPGSIKDGIINHNALIRTREYKLFKGMCKETEDEYATYHYPEDKGDERNLDENPVDSHNHIMKANEYVTRMTKAFRDARNEAGKAKQYNSLEEIEKALYGLDDITEVVDEDEEEW